MLFSKPSSDKSQLGVYWGKEAFCIAESLKGQPDKVAYVRFDTAIPGDQGQKIPDTLRLTALLQQILREKKILSKKANLTLSAKDVIYRSFVIPFMQPGEVKNVVDFEATKYIPIKLEDLVYTYHAIPFTEGDQKNLRILFVAARKTVLERYTNILQQAGLETEFIEPASVSLVRFLQKQGHIPRQHATGIIEIESEGGRITVTDKDVIQFVREFQSSIEGGGTPAENTKFFNDIRVSFNFYQRQNPQGKLDRITLLAEKDLSALSAGLTQDFKIPASALTIQKIIKGTPTGDLGLLSACGAALREKAVSSKNFDLTVKSRSNQLQEPGGVFANWNLKVLGFSLGLSIAAVYGMTVLTTHLTKSVKDKSAELKKELGIYESSTQEQITQLRDGVLSKTNQYKDARIKSDITFFLKKVPHLLPKGTWLNNLSVEYYEGAENTANGLHRVSKVSIGMEGYAYLPNSNERIRLVNNLINKIKKDPDFVKLFENIVLTNVKNDTFNNYPVTYFRITCK